MSGITWDNSSGELKELSAGIGLEQYRVKQTYVISKAPVSFVRHVRLTIPQGVFVSPLILMLAGCGFTGHLNLEGSVIKIELGKSILTKAALAVKLIHVIVSYLEDKLEVDPGTIESIMDGFKKEIPSA